MAVPEELKIQLKKLVEHFDKEDRSARQNQIKTWRRLKFLWDNLQHIYYSEVAHDWRIPEPERVDEQDYYDKPVNVFRAYLESIIAALSITVPGIVCYPDDADNPLDIITAKAGDKISKKIAKDNNDSLLWLHALFIYCTEGMTAAYNYKKTDKKFGTYEQQVTEDREEEETSYTCVSCNNEIGNEIPQDGICPNCGVPLEQFPPQPKIKTVTKQYVKEIKHQPKSRVMLDAFGGLYVKVPIYARRQEDCLYLIHMYETHYANVIAQYKELRGKIHQGRNPTDYEQWGRLSTQYRGEFPQNNITVRNCWFRPAAYNILEEADVKKLEKDFPDGIKVVMVDDEIADAYAEELDSVWTITYNPLSDHIHFDPLGLMLTSIQEITNDLISLVLQTIEHGIPQTFASTKVLDFELYKNSEVVPGGIYPAQMLTGRSLGDGFHEVKTATLSGEVLPFSEKVQELGQMASGALPSLFGGQVSGSRTASEYSMSRAQALQRLQNVWKILTSWWREIYTKAVPMYIKLIETDERDVERDSMGNFINVVIKKDELEGKIGKIELEANENLPLTWSQQKDVIMQLFEINNPKILETLASPENIPYLRRALGLSDYIIPGEDDRDTQYEEIAQLLDSEPFTMPGQIDPMTQQLMPDEEVPSVEIDPDLDDHQIHADICRRWLISAVGRQAKIDNITGYKNVLLHMKEHKNYLMAMMAQQQAAMMPAQPTGDNSEPPIEEVNNGPRTEQ